jgi:hypothetical protein
VISKAQVMALAAGDAWLNNGANLLMVGCVKTPHGWSGRWGNGPGAAAPAMTMAAASPPSGSMARSKPFAMMGSTSRISACRRHVPRHTHGTRDHVGGLGGRPRRLVAREALALGRIGFAVLAGDEVRWWISTNLASQVSRSPSDQAGSAIVG